MDTFETIAKQAVSQCQRLQAQNTELKQMHKQSSVADQAIINSTIQKLIKCGNLDNTQSNDAKQILLKDASAAFRTINALCDQLYNAQTITKTASDDLSCGELVSSAKKHTKTAQPDLTSVARILGIV